MAWEVCSPASGSPRRSATLFAGILLGPTALGAIFPAVQHWIFPGTGMSAAALGAVYQSGLLLLMFAAGAEMRQAAAPHAMRTVGLVAGFGRSCRSPQAWASPPR